MDLLSRIASWLGENEATISAVVGITVLAGVVFAGLRSLVRRQGETSQEKAPAVSPEASVATDSELPAPDSLTVPGFGENPAIAVLPFDNLSGDPDQEYFADGIAEDLITRLSAWRGFPVIARNSSFTYKGKAVDVKRVSRELGVRYVVEGSVRKVGDRIRISAQLIDAQTGSHVWAERYDRDLGDIFSLQDEITEAIIASMHPELVRFESARVARKDPGTLDAYDCVLRGGWHLGRDTREDCTAARAWFEKAADLDPQLSEAFVGIATTHLADVQGHWTDAPEQSVAEQSRAARKSVALNPQSSDAQVVLGWAYIQAGDQDEGIRAFERAITLDPSNTEAHGHLGVMLAFSGKPDEGAGSLAKAMRLDPRSPRLWYWLDGMAWVHFARGQYEEAIEWAQRSCKVNPDQPWAYRALAASYAMLGHQEEARSALAEELRLEPDMTISKMKLEPWDAKPDFVERYFDALHKAGLPE
jgi:TolB-like protein/tetratricopeptide (TPR) repeat protein